MTLSQSAWKRLKHHLEKHAPREAGMMRKEKAKDTRNNDVARFALRQSLRWQQR